MPTQEEALSNLNLPQPIPSAYTVLADYYDALERKGTSHPGFGLYPRDGSAEVADVESAISEITIEGQERNVVVASGMAAVFGALTLGLKHQYDPKNSERPSIAYANELYSQSRGLIRDFRSYGSVTQGFDSERPEEIDGLFSGEAPTVIFAETVANSANTPVLNVPHLLARLRDFDGHKPVVVLDNTLPLSTGVDFDSLLKPDDPVIVVESLTKGAMHNSGHLGVVYSPNEKLIEEFRRHKARIGSVTSTGVDSAIFETIQAATPTYRRRNLSLFASAAALHGALHEAQLEASEVLELNDPGFNITGPTLPKHPNYAFAQDTLPSGGSPVAWISDTTMDEVKARQRFEAILSHPRVAEQMDDGQVFYGQSFGFDTARFLYDPGDPLQLRIAGGYAIDSFALAEAIKEATLEAYIEAH
ncbi:MAG: PLP-dependent transferase [Candidatus Saccharimonadales bacterium]